MDIENIHIIDEAYGFRSACHTQTREGIVFTVKSQPHAGLYLLRPCSESAERKYFTYAIHSHLNKNGFENTDRILKTSCGGIFMELCGRTYTCSQIPQGRQCAVENDADLQKCALLLSAMHRASLGFTPAHAAELIQEIAPDAEAERCVRNDLGCVTALYQHRASELCRFKRLASRSRGRFDYEYLSIAEYYCRLAGDTCDALAASSYGTLAEACAAQGAICHKDYTSHNIIFSENAAADPAKSGGIINFDGAAIDLPLLDLTNLIKRRMRKCGWRPADANTILENYCKIRPLSADETELIKIVLRFPQKLWRIVNKYYNSRRSWCEKSCLLKLGEIKKEQVQMEEFLKSF